MSNSIFSLSLISAAATVLIGGSALAQNIPVQFVVTGDAAREINEYNQINGETARRIADTCETYARNAGRAVSIYILDQFGNHVHMHRMDGQDWINIRTAEMKARTALMMRQPSHARMNQARVNPFNQLYQITAHGLFPNSGGLPIIVNDQLIGTIGVGGAAPSPEFSDEMCAHYALTQIIGPQPPLLPVEPNRDPFTGEPIWCRGGAGPGPTPESPGGCN